MNDTTNKENFVLVKTLGGSRAYGLENKNSDYDYRGVFLNVHLSQILGLKKYEHQEFTKDEDVKYKEFRHFLNMLKVSNTEAMELMFTDTFLEVDPLFLELQTHRLKLLDSVQAYKCLRGYMQGEKKLANGERTGQLGSKRKEAIDTYGFSPKNFVQLFRLAWAGGVLFTKGYFPVNVPNEDPEFAKFLLEVKNEPHLFTKEQLNDRVDAEELKLTENFNNRPSEFNYTFDDDLANKYVLKAYYPLLTNYYKVS
jgi:hypothetical protein